MLLSTVLCLAGFAMMLERSAFAYADPGSGLMALQIIGATLSAVAIYLRHKIARLFGRRTRHAADGVSDSGSASEQVLGDDLHG